MFETMTSFVLVEHLYGKMFVGDGGHTGYTRVLDVWRQSYPTSDGYIGMMAYSDQQWQRFWKEVDRPHLATDSRFKEMASAAGVPVWAHDGNDAGFASVKMIIQTGAGDLFMEDG